MQRITKSVAQKVLSVVDAGLCSGMGTPVPGQMCVEAAVCFALDLPHSDDPGCVSPALRSLKIGLNDSNWSSKAARAKGLRRLAVAQLGSKDVLDEQEFMKRVAAMSIGTAVADALERAASIHPTQEHKQALMDAAKRCREERTEAARAAARAAAAVAAAAARAAAAVAAAWSAARAARAAARAAAEAAEAAAWSAAWSAAAWSEAEAAAWSAEAAAWSAEAAEAAAWSAEAAAYDNSLAAYCEQVVQILIEMDAPGCKWLALTE